MYGQLTPLLEFEYSQRYSLAWSQDVLLGTICESDSEVGYRALEFYLNKGERLKVTPRKIYYSFFRQGYEWVERLLLLLQNTSFESRSFWIDQYFMLLPDEYIKSSSMVSLLEHYETVSSKVSLYAGWLDKFQSIEPSIYEKVLRILERRRRTDSAFEYSLGYQFFRKSEHLDMNLSLCKAIYFQLDETSRDFDNDSGELFALFERDPAFLQEYVDHVCAKTTIRFSIDYKPLSKIWKYPNATEQLFQIFAKLKAKELYDVSQYMTASLFVGIDLKDFGAPLLFLQKTLDRYGQDPVVVNWVFNIARNYLKPRYLFIVQYFLQQNTNLEHFKKIELLNNHFSSTGNTVWSDVKAEELSRIHAAVRAIPQPTKYLGHLRYLLGRIEQEKRSACWTRKLRFMRLEH
jgi:hypothetical protein